MDIINIDNIKEQAQNNDELIASLQSSYDAMAADRINKIDSAIEHLTNSMYITAQKYLTANGVLQCMNVMNDVYGSTIFRDAKEMASQISDILVDMQVELEEGNYWVDGTLSSEFSEFLDKWYTHDFAKENLVTKFDMCIEILILDACQMFSSAFEDISSFDVSARYEMQKLEDEILIAKNKGDKNEDGQDE